MEPLLALDDRRLSARRRTPGLDLTLLARGGIRETHATLRPLPGESPAALARRLRALLEEQGASVVRHEVFGALAARGAALDAFRDALGAADWPVGWIEGNGRGRRGAIDGMHVFAVSGADVETIRLDGRPVGRAFDDGRARHALLHDVRPADASRPRPEQARRAYEALEAALRAAGMDFSHVARTWLFLDDILAWYGPLNAARTAFYRERGVFDRLVPASTGVGGRNAAGAALVAAAWAVRPHDGAPPAREIPSPLQCPAPQYGSSFSRAVEMDGPGFRRLLVSGTAGIAADGTTAHPGDVDGQIAVTMDVVRAILRSREMDFADVTRATVYCQDLNDLPRFAAWAAAHEAPPVPVVPAPAYICRGDLLFEIELDAVGPA